MIKTQIIADSKNEFGHRITSFVLTFPRIILAELNTHRVFSRNSSSSRAVPFSKMIQQVKENPFIPIAFQKNHKGMQGKEYLDESKLYSLEDFQDKLKKLLGDDLAHPIENYIQDVSTLRMSLQAWWLYARDRAIESAIFLNCFGATKQLCNRILEPFAYQTAIVTATDFENFFKLRCPKYIFLGDYYRSKRDIENILAAKGESLKPKTTIEWLEYNVGMGEIHIMELAEQMYDAMNVSVPKQLKAHEWHIPFGDNIDDERLTDLIADIMGGCDTDVNEFMREIEAQKEDFKIRISTARCARVSYLNFLGKDDYFSDIKLFEQLLGDRHASPFEHCAQAMSAEDLDNFVRIEDDKTTSGICRNFRGFMQYRSFLIED